MTWGLSNASFDHCLLIEIGVRDVILDEMTLLGVPRHFVDVFEVTPKIAALSEGLLAHGAGKGSLAGVLAEVVSQVATFLEDTLTARVFTFEVKFDALAH